MNAGIFVAFLRQQVEAPHFRVAVEETPRPSKVTPFSTMRSPTPSRSKISSVRFDQQIARLPTETTSLSSSTTEAVP